MWRIRLLLKPTSRWSLTACDTLRYIGSRVDNRTPFFELQLIIESVSRIGRLKTSFNSLAPRCSGYLGISQDCINDSLNYGQETI